MSKAVAAPQFGRMRLSHVTRRYAWPVGGTDANIQIDLAGIPLRNPVLLAAGTAGLLDEMGGKGGPLDLSRVGGVVTKSITRSPRDGNPVWRVLEHRAGMLNAIGLANPGLDAFEAHVLPRAASVPTRVLASVAGFSIDDYTVVAATFDEWGDRGIKAIELNVSCPNVRTGTEFGAAPGALAELMKAVRPVVTRTRLFVKLSPATPDIVGVAKAAIEGGADGLTICNTIPAMLIDPETRRPRLANVTGGLSGPALHPIAVRLVHEVYRKVAKDAHGVGRGVPIIGAGGVMTWEDAAEFILAGATAVQMGTALFVDPRSPLKVVRGLERWTRRQKCTRIGELVGAVVLP